MNVQGTNAGKIKNIDTGAGTNTINAGNALSLVDGIKGFVNVNENGGDTLNVVDCGSKKPKNAGELRIANLTGLGMGSGGSDFSGLAALNITLGASNDTMTVVNTPAR